MQTGMDDDLMTVEEFNARVLEWGRNVRARALASISRGTHGQGTLGSSLADFEDPAREKPDGPVSRIKFGFVRYGVFRSYGVGRGYVIRNGMLIRGERVLDSKGQVRPLLRERVEGYSRSQLRRMKWSPGGGGNIKRTPLNWLDKHLDDGLDELAGLVSRYYGDEATRQMAKNFDNIKIVKDGK